MEFQNFSFSAIANFAVALAIVIAGILAVFYIIKGGIMAITAGGDGEKLKQGMHAVRYSIVGLVIVVLAVFMIKIVGAVININLLPYLTLENITAMFEVIMERLEGNYTPMNDKPF